MKVKSLSGKVVMVTRSAEQAEGFAKLLQKEGAVPFLFPTIKTVPVAPDKETKEALTDLESFDVVVFASVNSVRWLLSMLDKENIEFPEGIKIAAVGAATAAYLSSLGYTVDIIPSEYIAESLVDAVGRQLPPGGKVLIPRAKVTREVVGPELKKRGFSVSEVITYETIPDDSQVNEAVEALEREMVDAVTFTSGSTVKNFYQLLSGKIDIGKALNGVVIAVIGPITAKAVEEVGLEVNVIPEEYTMPGMIEALKAYFSKSSKADRNS